MSAKTTDTAREPDAAERMRYVRLLDRLRDAKANVEDATRREPLPMRIVSGEGASRLAGATGDEATIVHADHAGAAPSQRVKPLPVEPQTREAVGRTAPSRGATARPRTHYAASGPAPDAPLLERFEHAMARAGQSLDTFLDRWFPPAGAGGTDGGAHARLWTLIRPASVAGIAIVVLCFGVVGTWAAFAPLSGAAVATGVVSPDGSRKTIQHLEGGIIREILVKEGDQVAAGQMLYKLEVTQAQATYTARREQWLRLLATKARLEAHSADAERMNLPPAVTEDPDAELVAFIRNQVELFELRKRGLDERESILRQQLRQLEEQTKGKKLENEGLAEQLRLLDEEAKDKAQLVAQKLARKPEFLAVQRTIADVKSRIGSNIAQIASLEERAGEIKLQINNTRTQFRNDNADQLTKTNNDLAQLEESLVSTQDILKRTAIVAPTSGTILNMRYKTVGGVIRPGEPVVDLVPREDQLIMDAKLPATDIDVVKPGLQALVHLVPYLTRDTPMLEGTVTHVSADSTADQQSGQRFYEVKVKVERAALDKLSSNVVLSPGMPVEVFVVTRNRTALGYFMEPLTRSFRRAFRED